ncbi:MAG: response regulator transcription factor [Actinomycetota bacterium]
MNPPRVQTSPTDPEVGADDRRRPGALVVDGDGDAAAVAGDALAKEGFAVLSASSSADARRVLEQRAVDLVILEVALPDGNGLRLLQEFRSTSSVPVIIVSANTETTDRVVGLRLGADDYLAKPVAPAELEARIDAVFRRTRMRPPASRIDFDDGLSIDLEAREVSRGSVVVALRPREFDVLAELATHPRRVYSRDELLRSVWHSSPEWQTSATVTEHIRKLRRAIETDPDHPKHLVTIRGVGYRFDP